jgi:hypothetical protein
MRTEAGDQLQVIPTQPMAWDSPEFNRLMRVTIPGKVKYVSFAGRKVLLADLSRTRGVQSIAVMAEMVRVVALYAPASVLMLVDLTDWVFDTHLLAIAAEAARRNAHFMKKCAVVGATGLRSIAFRTILRESGRENLRCASTRKDALNWLVLPESLTVGTTYL